MALAGAGVPVDRVRITGPASADVTYMPGVTAEQLAAGAAIIAGFDWSPEADAEYEAARTRNAAVKSLAAQTPELIATRAACVALMLSLQEARAKLNELIAATGAGVAPLATGESVSDAMGTVAQLIQSGAV